MGYLSSFSPSLCECQKANPSIFSMKISGQKEQKTPVLRGVLSFQNEKLILKTQRNLSAYPAELLFVSTAKEASPFRPFQPILI